MIVASSIKKKASLEIQGFRNEAKKMTVRLR